MEAAFGPENGLWKIIKMWEVSLETMSTCGVF